MSNLRLSKEVLMSALGRTKTRYITNGMIEFNKVVIRGDGLTFYKGKQLIATMEQKLTADFSKGETITLELSEGSMKVKIYQTV